MNANEARQILDIPSEGISKEELKLLFKKKLLQWHPDLAVHRGIDEQEATIQSQRIILAFEIVSENLESIQNPLFGKSYDSYYHYKTSSNKSYMKYYDYSIDKLDENFINRITLKSSNVKWIDYIKDLQVLVVRFKNSSGYYIYYDVPMSVHLKFQTTDSPGRFVHQYLRSYKYDSFGEYATWLSIYRSLEEITNS